MAVTNEATDDTDAPTDASDVATDAPDEPAAAKRKKKKKKPAKKDKPDDDDAPWGVELLGAADTELVEPARSPHLGREVVARSFYSLLQ